jgi:hypothetical protein
MRQLIRLAVVSSVMFLAPVAAVAGSSDTSSVACGSSAVAWSVPKGGLVTHAASGPIAAVLNAVGETRTHVMLSHGSGQWVTHSTMFDPGTNGWPKACDLPVRGDEMRRGFPGASQVSQPAIYTFLFGGGSTHYLGYSLASSGDRRTDAEQAADWAWFSTPWIVQTSRKNSGQSFYRLGENELRACQYNNWGTANQNNCPASWLGTGDGCDCGCQVQDPDCRLDTNFHSVDYSFYNYYNVSGRPYDELTTEHGSQCSSYAANLHRNANGDYVQPHTYSHNQTVAAGNALYASVENQCKSGLGDWGILAGVGTVLACFDTSICDDAARQVRNCFVDPAKCDNSDSGTWSNLANNANAKATSISPDRLIGAAGHFPQGSAHAGPWTYNAEVQVTWNSAGSVYGCWF